MASADVTQPRVLSQTPGRLRVHLAGLDGMRPEQVAARLRRLPGVESVRFNPLTGNVLVRFDERTAQEEVLLAEIAGAATAQGTAAPSQPREGLPTTRDAFRSPGESREPAAPRLIRAGVRGVLGHAALDSLWFAAGFLGQSLGLPLAGLGTLHVLADLAVWGIALGSAAGGQNGREEHRRSG